MKTTLRILAYVAAFVAMILSADGQTGGSQRGDLIIKQAIGGSHAVKPVPNGVLGFDANGKVVARAETAQDGGLVVFKVSAFNLKQSSGASSVAFTIPAGKRFICTGSYMHVRTSSNDWGSPPSVTITNSIGGPMWSITATTAAIPAEGAIRYTNPEGLPFMAKAAETGNVNVTLTGTGSGGTSMTADIYISGFYAAL